MEEFVNLSKAFNPKHPFLFILGGAKFSTKMPLVEKFLGIADKIYITGALSNDIFKAKGLSVGKSLVGEDNPDLKKLLENNPKILYPKDITVLNVKSEKENKKIDNIAEGDYVADIGETSLLDLQQMIKDFSFVLWNGPTGNYEIGFKENTEKLAETLSLSDAEVLIGGGDTVSAIQSLNILDRFSFVSTAGGAMLDFLANGTLPAIEAIQDSK
jgi:phosphoglycerate kinase